jgi:hypothetical protein
MIGLCVELMAECTGCRQPVAINSLVTQVFCSRCSRPVEVSVERWKSLLEDVILKAPKLELKEGRTSTMMGGAGTLNLMYGRMNPRCEGCKTELVLAQAMEQARSTNGYAGCASCQKWIAIRVPPGDLLAQVAPGVTCLIGEDPAQLQGQPTSMQTPNAGSPVFFPCPQCGGGLKVDGSNRMVPCQFCGGSAYLPDDLWQRLHPAVTASRWYLMYDEQAAKAVEATRPFPWKSLFDAVIDEQGLLYCCGEAEGTSGRWGNDDDFVVWQMGNDMIPRWVRKDLKYDSEARLAWSPDGTLLLWSEKKHSLLKLSRADGTTVAKLGGGEPAGATVHHLDLKDAEHVCADVDGSLLVIIFDRVLRFTPDGQATTTWPPGTGIFSRKEKLRPLYTSGAAGDDDDSSSRDRVKGEYSSENVLDGRPLSVPDHRTRLRVGWDGHLYMGFEDGEYGGFARLDRDGKVVMKHRLGNRVDIVRDQFGVDQSGQIFTRLYHDGRKQLVRISADGKSRQTLLDDREKGGLLADERVMLVAPNGMIWLLDSYQEARAFGPDGSPLWMSPKAIEEDAEFRERKQKKIEADED